MARRIRIIATPSGEAPLEIRQAWVGLEFPILPELDLPDELEEELEELFPSHGVLGGPGDTENLGGYKINYITAIRILREKDPIVANWWITKSVCNHGSNLIFGKKFCQLIE